MAKYSLILGQTVPKYGPLMRIYQQREFCMENRIIASVVKSASDLFHNFVISLYSDFSLFSLYIHVVHHI